MLTTGAWPQDSYGNDIGETNLLESFSVPRVYDWYYRPDRPEGECRGVAWSSDGLWFGWSCGYKVVRVIRWDSEKNRSVTPQDVEEGTAMDFTTEINTGDFVGAIAFGTKRATASPRKSGKSQSIWGGNVVTSGQSSICRKELIPGEVVLATGQANGRIRIWDILTGQLKFELCDHVGQIESLHFSSVGNLRVASASADGSMKVWDLDESGNLQATLKSPRGLFRDCRWSPDATKLATVGDHKSVFLWDTVSYELIRKLEGHLHNVCRCDFSPDGSILATCSYDTRVIIWDVTTGKQLFELNHCQPPPSLMYAGGANGMYVRGLSFSPDGQFISTVCDDGYMRVWELENPDHPVLVSSARNALVVQYSSTGTAISVGTTKGCVSIWAAPSVVPALQHLCRVVIRQHLKDSTLISRLNMTTPPALQRYLQYKKDWRFLIE